MSETNLTTFPHAGYNNKSTFIYFPKKVNFSETLTELRQIGNSRTMESLYFPLL